MSQDMISLLESQIPVFDKLRRTAMLVNAMRATTSKGQLLKFVNAVNASLEFLIQLNQRSIAVLQQGETNDNTTSSEAGTGPAGDGQEKDGSGTTAEVTTDNRP